MANEDCHVLMRLLTPNACFDDEPGKCLKTSPLLLGSEKSASGWTRRRADGATRRCNSGNTGRTLRGKENMEQPCCCARWAQTSSSSGESGQNPSSGRSSAASQRHTFFYADAGSFGDSSVISTDSASLANDVSDCPSPFVGRSAVQSPTSPNANLRMLFNVVSPEIREMETLRQGGVCDGRSCPDRDHCSQHGTGTDSSGNGSSRGTRKHKSLGLLCSRWELFCEHFVPCFMHDSDQYDGLQCSQQTGLDLLPHFLHIVRLVPYLSLN